jgi:hypothetical protein
VRVATRSTLTTEVVGIELTKTEHALLMRAGALADRIRTRAVELQHVGGDGQWWQHADGGQYGDELARISIAVDELDNVPWPRFVPVVITDTLPPL